MDLDTQAALAVLAAWRATLPDLPPDTEFGPPSWAWAETVPVLVYRVRGCDCYVFAFMNRRAGASGFVLNADWLHYQLIHGGSREALAAALSIVTMRPAPTRRNGRREV